MALRRQGSLGCSVVSTLLDAHATPIRSSGTWECHHARRITTFAVPENDEVTSITSNGFRLPKKLEPTNWPLILNSKSRSLRR